MGSILQFRVVSGKICVSDPCYEKGTWCAAWDLDAKVGLWTCYVFEENIKGGRVKEILCLSQALDEATEPLAQWKQLEFDIGVDSGQCGVFDYADYPNGSTGEFGDLTTFYGKCCKMTLDNAYGTLDFGFVTNSGYGDGSYTMYGLYDEDEKTLIGVRVVFIDDVETEDEYMLDNYDDEAEECEAEPVDEDEL